MNKLEIITASNSSRINEIGSDLAATYKVAFAGEPWYEVSRCVQPGCANGFSEAQPGCTCSSCGETLVEAYDADGLIANWQEMLTNERAFMEVAFEEGAAQRATIARPTTAQELMERKYRDVPVMAEWLSKRFSNEFVWIEDTFADRERKPTGNLDGRGETLRKIAAYYGGALILTRTLSPAIVKSTLRDCKAFTSVFIGENGVGDEAVSSAFGNPGYALPTVPDRRTLLAITANTRARV